MRLRSLGVLLIIFGCVLLGVYFLIYSPSAAPTPNAPNSTTAGNPAQSDAPERILLDTDYHIFQTFNNCAPAALSMALSYYGISASQERLAAELRPWNNLRGDNDDKSTPPDELAAKAQEYGLVPYFRANGTIERLEELLAAGEPVIVRTLLYPDKDFAHYRVIKGYDRATQEIIQDDSLQGKNIRYSYEAFLHLWKPFNYAYLVLTKPENKGAIETILGDELDARIAWDHVRDRAIIDLQRNGRDTTARFNFIVASYYLGDYTRATEEFESIEHDLPMHTLWYQLEPIAAYFELKNYARVYSLTQKIFDDNNRGYSELYLLRGKSFLAEGNTEAAKAEFAKAVYYNIHSKSAEEALGLVAND